MINEQLDGQLRMATLDPLEGKQFQVLKRDGRVVEFDETRIYLAIEAALKADVGSIAQIESMIKDTVSVFRSLDIIVNNAGVTRAADIMELTRRRLGSDPPGKC